MVKTIRRKRKLFIESVSVAFPTYNGFLSAIPNVWKKSILNSEPLKSREEHSLISVNVTAKTAHNMFMLKMLKPPNVERKLVKQNLSAKAI